MTTNNRLNQHSAEELLKSEFWKELKEATNHHTYGRWLSAKAPKEQLQLRMMIDFTNMLEETLIRVATAASNSGGEDHGTQNIQSMN